MRIHKEYSMREHSNMKVGGVTKNFFIVEDKNEVIDILENYQNVFVIGNGTNTLINDKDLKTNFLSLKELKRIVELGENLVLVEAGVDFSDLVQYAEKMDYSGLENLAGIPGTLGGLVYMNGGAYGSEIFDKIVEIEVVDEEKKIRRIKKEEMDFSYRNTEIQRKGWIVISATFKFDTGYKSELVIDRKGKREARHPLNMPNLGSSFKNPKDHFAAKLIIESGMQGYRVGDAQVSLVHPNFIVNHGNATFDDMIKLIEDVKREVLAKTGILLEEEIVIVNE